MTEVWITGIGLVSSLGEGLDAHFEALSATAPQPVVDEARFAPYPVHPVVRLELDKQIPRKADQRQMEPWQRLGTYAAGLALADAGITGNAELLSRMDMIVAAGGGERDVEVDSQILAGLETAADADSFLNERLSNDLRPTLFLAQLSNLLAGNISIVHKVTGSSRTFMGEELAGVSAIEIAARRIASGQGDVFLVGAAYNAERIDVLLNLALGGHLWKGAHVPVWSREGEGGGLVTGSMSGFLVLESPEHAKARGAKPYARLLSVLSDRCRRVPGEATENGRRAVETLKPLIGDRPVPVISGATGAAPITGEERDFLAGLREEGLVGPVRALTSLVGAGYDATFPVLVALAALALSRGSFYGSDDPTAFEGETGDAPERILVNCWGHWRGEGMALLAAAD